ncbi:MAG: hypothetical protein ACFE0R_16715 [Salinarimonas sp.]
MIEAPHDERALWLAVYKQALEDACSTSSVKRADKRAAAERSRTEALEWLTTPSADFDRVCALAGIEPCQARSFAERTIAANDKRSSPRGLVEHNGERRTLDEWARLTGIGRGTLAYRLRTGWPIARALTEPVPPSRSRKPEPIGPGVGRDSRQTCRDRRGSLRARNAENREFPT